MASLEAVARELSTSGASLKIVSVEHIHLTLKFLGNTDEGLVPDITAAIQESCRGRSAFEIRLHGMGAFPNLSRMNVVWVGIDGAEPLVEIAKSLDRSLEPLGFRPEGRPWSAHATIARVKGGRSLDRVRQILEAHRDDRFGAHRVEDVRLKKSVLTPQGPIYTTIETVALSA